VNVFHAFQVGHGAVELAAVKKKRNGLDLILMSLEITSKLAEFSEFHDDTECFTREHTDQLDNMWVVEVLHYF